MKTLLFTLEYPPFFGGVSRYYKDIVDHWPASAAGKPEILVLHNNEGKLVRKRGLIKWLPAFGELFKILKKEKIEHILVGHILPLGTVAYLVTRITKTPYSVFLHGMDLAFSQKKARRRWLARRILRGAARIICVNSFVAKQAKEVIGESEAGKIIVINPGVEPKLILENKALEEKLKRQFNLEGKTILYCVSRLVKRKGQDKTIEAMALALKEAPELVYVVGGVGPDEDYLKEKIEELPEDCRKSIIFWGETSDEEKWAWWNLSDIFVMPSRNIAGDYEGFGIVYIETNLLGKPVIAGDSGGVRDAVIDGYNGLLVDPEDVDAIARAIIKLAKDKALREELGRNGRERALKEFNWEGQIAKLYRALK